jgi:hypothetical protein
MMLQTEEEEEEREREPPLMLSEVESIQVSQ